MAGNGTRAGIEQRIELGLAQVREAAAQLLASLCGAEEGDRQAAVLSLEVAASLGVVEQAAHGLRLQVLAQADRLRAARGGIGPWLAVRQGQSYGRARSLAHDARLLATVPQLAPDLASGELSADAVRLLARTVKACKDTSMDPGKEVSAALNVARTEGVSAAADHVRALEYRLDPNRVKALNERQRQRSLARAEKLESGMWRFEVLLDPARATILKAALEALTSSWLGDRGRDGTVVLPTDVTSTEQINAHAFHRLAEVFLAAPSRVRRAAFSPPVLFFAPLPGTESAQGPASGTAGGAGTSAEIPAGCALSAYGDVVPLSAVAPVHRSSTHLLYTNRDSELVLVDGEVIDPDPNAHPTSQAQRIALAFRERVSTFGGRARTTTRPLDSHHQIPRPRTEKTSLRSPASEPRSDRKRSGS